LYELTKNRGFVWSVEGDEIIVALQKGGKMRCKNNGFTTGDRVVIILDSSGRKAKEVISEAEALHAVRCGIDPIYAAWSREPEITEEEEYDFQCRESDDIYGIA